MKPVCVKCQRFYRPKKVGTPFIEMMPRRSAVAEPGTGNPEAWKPYKLWMGDLWCCQGCGHELISGVGFTPLSEHFKADFTEQCQAWNASIRVNDC